MEDSYDPDADRHYPWENVVILPIRPMLFTVDQVASMVGMDMTTLRRSHVYFVGRSVGANKATLLIARNIAGGADKPDWRIAENEFVRWLKVKGFRIERTGKILD